MSANLITPSNSPVLTVLEGADLQDQLPKPNPLANDSRYYPTYTGGKIVYRELPQGNTRIIKALTAEDYVN